MDISNLMKMELLMIVCLMFVNAIGAAGTTTSDLNQHHLQLNHLANHHHNQYSVHDATNKDDHLKQLNDNNNPHMDEHEAIRILLQNYKSSRDNQPINSNINNRNPQPQPQPPSPQQWNPYSQNINNNNNNNDQLFSSINRYSLARPTVTYVQPIFIPILFNPQQFLSSYSDLGTDYEDSMARTNINHRRTTAGTNTGSSTYRNSPIYYVRLPPTSYTLLPALNGYGSAQHNFGTPTYNPLPFMEYNLPLHRALTSYHNQPASILNLPVNFLANGKPTNIYQPSSNMDMSPQLPYHPNQLQLPPQPQLHQQQQSHFSTSSPSLHPTTYQSQQHQHEQQHATFIQQPAAAIMNPDDSKITSLKRQYFFNGRPDDEVFILPSNSFDRWNANYQNSIPQYY